MLVAFHRKDGGPALFELDIGDTLHPRDQRERGMKPAVGSTAAASSYRITANPNGVLASQCASCAAQIAAIRSARSRPVGS